MIQAQRRFSNIVDKSQLTEFGLNPNDWKLRLWVTNEQLKSELVTVHFEHAEDATIKLKGYYCPLRRRLRALQLMPFHLENVTAINGEKRAPPDLLTS